MYATFRAGRLVELLTGHPYGPTPSGYPGQGAPNTAVDYALSAVDMVAGRKTRDQLQSFANSRSTFFY